METPIADFVNTYRESGTVRLHMPGHKGRGPLGCEALDITEITGADALYEAEGIIARSEKNAAALFGTAATLYSTEGSSQCIRAMLYLALLRAETPEGRRPVVVAARNAHKVFLLTAALLDFDVVWLWQAEGERSLCRCAVSPQQLEETLRGLPFPPTAVYVTSPDYLGGELDIRALAETAHAFGVPLLVDDAHGAYQKFLPGGRHPMEQGADLCCDSAHKTLPVLTGGAYLHVSRTAPACFAENGKRALSLFGSTSPSYLILQSLDLANRRLAEDYPERLRQSAEGLTALKRRLEKNGWRVAESDPLKLTLLTKESGWLGSELSRWLHQGGIEWEYADPDALVLMVTPENTEEDLRQLEKVLGRNPRSVSIPRPDLRMAPPEQVCTPRQAMRRQAECIPAEQAEGRVLADPSVGCPPAVPVVVSGERITAEAVEIFRYYGIHVLHVLPEAVPHSGKK